MKLGMQSNISLCSKESSLGKFPYEDSDEEKEYRGKRIEALEGSGCAYDQMAAASLKRTGRMPEGYWIVCNCKRCQAQRPQF